MTSKSTADMEVTRHELNRKGEEGWKLVNSTYYNETGRTEFWFKKRCL